MKITTIGCSGTFEVGRPAFKKYWMEAEIEEGEDVDKSVEELNRRIDGFNERFNVQEVDKVKNKPKTVQTVASSILDDIKTCKEVKVLESYKLIAKGKPELEAAYNEKYLELTEG